MKIRKSQAELEGEGRAAVSSISLGDEIDYRAMLARERYESTRKAGPIRSYLPMSAVLMELQCGAPLRVLYDLGAIL